MDLMINKGIVKKNTEGEFTSLVLKDLEKGIEFPLSTSAIGLYDLQEGDLVEFSGRVQGNNIFFAIGGVEYRALMN